MKEGTNQNGEYSFEYNPSGGELIKAIEQVLDEEEEVNLDASAVHARILAYHPDWSLSERRVAKFIKRAHSGKPINLPFEESSRTEASTGSLSLGRFLRRKQGGDNASIKSRDRSIAGSLRSVSTSISKMLRKKKRKSASDDDDSLQSRNSLRTFLAKNLSSVRVGRRRGKRDKVAHSSDEEFVQDPEPVSSEEKDAIKAAIDDILQREAARQKMLDNMTSEDPDEEELRNIGGMLGSPYHDDNDWRREEGCVSWWNALFSGNSHKNDAVKGSIAYI